MLLSTSLATLINGVSQQAQNLRYSSQCDEQINASASVLTGLTKRPNTRHVANLPLSNVPFLVESLNRSETEQHTLILGDQLLRVFDMAGVEIPVKNAAGSPITTADLAYLHTSTPSKSLAALTVADYTVLLNRDKVTALSSSASPATKPAAIVFCKQLRRGADYTLRIYNTPTSTSPSYAFTLSSVETDIDSTTSSDPKMADQTAVVKWFESQIAGSGANSVYDHLASDSILYLTKKDGSDFRLEVECSLADGFAVLKDSAQAFTELPKKGVSGFTIKIVGAPDDGGDEYYVRYTPTNPAVVDGVICTGVWEEAQAGGLYDDLDASTMPHALLNFGTYFQFKPLTWGSRGAGDADTNPPPSFVGKPINSVIFHKNRLGILSGENVVLSEESSFWNFWRTSVIQLLDADPIDTSGSSARIATLNAAVATSEKFVMFSAETQFVLTSGDALTPATAGIKQCADYSNIPTVTPKAVGNSVYFAFKHGDFSGFQEFYVSPDTSLFTADNVTEHVPNYLKGLVTAFAISDKAETLLAATDGATDSLYCYNYFKQGSQRLQSAWGRWQFSGTVRGFYTIGTTLYLVMQRGTAFSFEALELAVGQQDSHSEYVTLLDRRVSDADVSASYDAIHDTTIFTLPYDIDADTATIARRATATTASGTVLPCTPVTASTLRVSGNHTTTPLWFGESYSMVYTMSRPQLRDTKANGAQVIVPGRFQVRYGELAYAGTLYFRVEVQPVGRRSFSYPFSPTVSGTFTATTGSSPSPQDGVKRFTVNSKNDQVTINIINDSPLPCALLSCDWTALYAAKAQRA